MEFRILGPLEIADDGRRVELGGRMQRALLAILLIHANEVVTADKLIDELWGETPPPTAAKTLQAHVSRLRKAINATGRSPDADGPLETRGPGYVLKVEPGQLDAERFQLLVAEARRALARGEARSAAENAGEALALWRGPPLADFTYEAFAQEEIARLEEFRLSAVEERIEAELALGRHAEVIAELDTLVARHPLRERLRGQLMLALYRSERQAEALDLYQRGRRALAEELGLEPSQALQRLERQILDHDAAIAATAPRGRPSSGPVRGGQVRRSFLLAGVLLLAAAVGIAVFQLPREGGGATTGEPSVDASGVGMLDPKTGELLAAIPFGTAPANVAVGEGAVWVLDADDRTVSQIDPETRAVQKTFSTASTPTDLAAGGGAVWIGNGGDFASFPVSISRVDPESGVLDATIDLPGSSVRGYLQGGGFTQQFMAVTDGTVWVVNPDQTVSRIDPRTNDVVATVDVRASSIAAGDGGVWVVDEEGVAEIDPETNAIAWRTDVKGEALTSLAVGAGAVWAADPIGGSVWRIDPRPNDLQRTVPVGLGVNSVAFGEGAVWATNEVAGLVHRIDPSTNRAQLVSRITAPGGVAVGETGVWVTSAGQPSADAALPASACRDIYYGGAGSPRFLIASDLPLQGGARAWTAPLVDAIRFILERRGFRAGPYSVGYQSCDDSTAQANGFDVYRCFSNARAYARTPDVLGVIGAFNFGCSMVEIPIANQAPGGPLAMISPSNTPTFLTRAVRGRGQGELEELYPSGNRNFVRIAAADHLAAPALVEAVRELGAHRVAVLWDREDADAAAYAADMSERARAIGLELADSAAWNPFDGSFDAVARRVAAARPDAVLLAGAGPPHVDSMLRDLRARLGRRVALIASDGFWGVSGPDAQGMYIGSYGIPNAELPPVGKQFLGDLEASGGVSGPDFTAVYGAQAAEILLDAIARSDGTRASVTRELFETDVEDGILGDIRFDEYGDLVEGPVTIYRVAGKRMVVDRVVWTAANP